MAECKHKVFLALLCLIHMSITLSETTEKLEVTESNITKPRKNQTIDTAIPKSNQTDNLDTAESKNYPIKSDSETLDEAESRDKLEIVKRIKKINDDGSYTIGYEADDGSFKIESRDVLGNVKGTYGFIDENGEIKRISYSTTNSSNMFSSPQTHPEVSVVQRIAKTTIITPRPAFSSTTQEPSTTPRSNVIQTVTKKRPLVLSSTTTPRPKFLDIRTTTKMLVSTSATPRILLQRPSNKDAALKTITENPTKVSLYHTIPTNKIYEEEKPVTEEPSEIRTSVLRRELPHFENIKEIQIAAEEEDNDYHSYHRDTQDVYNTGMTENVRPLFTTSSSARKLFPVLSGTTSVPVLIPRPTRYPSLYQRGYNVQDTNEAEKPNHVTSTEAPSSPVPTIVPVVQIPANKPPIRYAQTPEEIKYAQSSVRPQTTARNQPDQKYNQGQNYHQRTQDPLVAVRHPFHKGAILVPLSQLQGTIIPIENMGEVDEARRYFVNRNIQQQSSATEVQIEKQKLFRVENGTPPLKSLPVQVEQGGFIREVSTTYPVPAHVTTGSPIAPKYDNDRLTYSTPLHITPNVPTSQKYVGDEVSSEIDNIETPVSTRDFQRLLNQLIKRQRKLEKLNEIMRAKLPSLESYQTQVQPVLVRPVPMPVKHPPYVLRSVPRSYRQYEPQPQESDVHPRQFVIVPQGVYTDQAEVPVRYQITNEDSSVRREGILSRSSRQHNSPQDTEEYLSPEVREMLLLKMLKLAINPALPVEEDVQQDSPNELQTATKDSPQYKRAPVRNVEILGEENAASEDVNAQRVERSKRDKEEDMEVME